MTQKSCFSSVVVIVVSLFICCENRTINDLEISPKDEAYLREKTIHILDEPINSSLPAHYVINNHNNILFSNHNALPSRIKRNAGPGLPQRVDWREKGILTKIKDQKNCGACWAFSVLETVETMYALKTGSLVDLSVQQLIDCSVDGSKCNGGDTCLTLKWLVQDKVKILPEKKYPTTLVNEECENEHPKNGVIVSSYECHDYSKNETEILKTLANHGPVVVAVNSRVWHDYLGGIVQYHCDSQVDHAVQIVGYDLTGDVPYYIVRNSWGTSFGHDGYLYVKIGANVCGIAQEVASVTV